MWWRRKAKPNGGVEYALHCLENHYRELQRLAIESIRQRKDIDDIAAAICFKLDRSQREDQARNFAAIYKV